MTTQKKPNAIKQNTSWREGRRVDDGAKKQKKRMERTSGTGKER